MKVTDAALRIAVEAHGGTVNKHDGEIYLLHVIRVAQDARLRAKLYGVDPGLAEAVGYLHDTLEDTELTSTTLALKLADFNVNEETIQEIVHAVLALTKDGSTSNVEYYRRVAQVALARVVKLSDMTDNFRRNHNIADDEKRLRLAKKYSVGLNMLT